MTRPIFGSSSQTYLVGSCAEAPPPPFRAQTRAAVYDKNLSIATDTQTIRKTLLKTSSFQIPRVQTAPVDGLSSASLGITESNTPQHVKSIAFRAAESGKGDLLPRTYASNRRRCASVTRDYVAESSAQRFPPVEETNEMTQFLRVRRRSTVQLEELDARDTRSARNQKLEWTDSFHKLNDRSYRLETNFNLILRKIRVGNLSRALFVGVILYFVWDSQRKARSTTRKLEVFKRDEEMMMLHLQRIEQHSISLTQSIGRLTDDPNKEDSGRHVQPVQSEAVNSKLQEEQIRILTDMEEELNHELRALKANLQHIARRSIVQRYGEGPVQVILELDFHDGSKESSQICILLWYDTPHAAWTWLQQVHEGVWNDSRFTLSKGFTIDAVPPPQDIKTNLEFVEKSQKQHEAWTVGLSEADGGSISMFINLRDNSSTRKHDVCVGKIIDGFDALQKLVDMSRRNKEGAMPVTVKNARASHLTRSQTQGLI